MPSRFVIVLLLIFQGALTAYGASPWMSAHCGCTHGAEVPCDCPHHLEAGADDDASLPPCHRAMKDKQPRPPPTSSPEPVFKNRCGGSGPVLVLLSLVPLPEPSFTVHWLPQLESRPADAWVDPARALEPPKPPPPRMSV